MKVEDIKIHVELLIKLLIKQATYFLYILLRKARNLFVIIYMCKNWYDVLFIQWNIKEKSTILLRNPSISIKLTKNDLYNFLCLIKLLRKNLIDFGDYNKIKLKELDFQFEFSEAGDICTTYILFEEARRKLNFHVHKLSNNVWSIKFDFHGNTIEFHVPFWWLGIFKEIYCDEVYNDPDIKAVDAVIDIGAAFGDSSIYFALKGARHVIALEPLPITYKYLIKNIEINKLSDRIEARNLAVGAETGFLRLFSYKDIMLGKHGSGEGLMVPSIRLSELIDELRKRGMNNLLLKMDCEGCEHDVLPEAARSGSLSYINKLIIEVHGNVKSIIKLLRDQGFKVKIYRVYSPEMVIIRAFRTKR
ncbi:FkbM family methyltransferase [Vulcanisaeta thermophila]|uniref:FkbM family methyltransferase n=1 Tax=Vulcanisaeta thermophila TaxID=867917 RepID=UPI000852D477|nr:FkbM family methyltransferase [Vulcanisaeta thermophila]